jgi:hypothetical protein
LKTLIHSILLALSVLILPFSVSAQQGITGGQVSGNFQMDAQYYTVDSSIGAEPVPEKMLMNSWTNVIYNQGNFNAGLRFETYLNPVSGFYKDYKGLGVPYWFADYKTGMFQVTAGHVYEQFGSGMIFRTYEEHNLGYDNSLNGIRLKFNPYKGIQLKGIYGVQRYFWQKGPGIVRGLDADVDLNDLLGEAFGDELKMQVGGSFVSKFEENQYKTNNQGEELILPLNVGSGAGRFNLEYNNFSLGGEYVQKANDPNILNNYIYKKGEALLLQAGYNQKGLGVFVQAKRLDNISFKSRRDENLSVLDVNYLPAITKQQAYTLAAFYPYATQPNSEMGISAQVNYKVKKDTWLGGHYGMDIALNASMINSIDKQLITDSASFEAPGTVGYKSSFFKVGDVKYFRDYNIEISRKFSKSFKMMLGYMYEDYNPEVIAGHAADPMIHADIIIADMTYKFTPTHALRMELQSMTTKQDLGDWFLGMLEYTVAPRWFFSVSDQWNYGNEFKEKRNHFPLFAVTYNNDANRIQISYGKVREGIICVGGVCRNVPASNGLTISVTTNF